MQTSAPSPPRQIVVAETVAPALDIDGAVERLNAGEEPRLFFSDAAAGPGQVLYRPCDDHYGLVSPD